MQEKATRANALLARQKAYNPVKAGVQRRRKLARAEREQKNEYFKQAAITASIERSREKKREE